MTKILVAVDGTEASRRAAEVAQQLFQGDDVSFTAVNVARHPVDWLPATPYGGIISWPTAMRADSSPADEAYARRESVAEAVASQQVPPGTDVEVVFGETVTAICAAAEDINADVIVVGSHDKGFLQRLFGGSVSEELVRTAPRPVLVVR